LPENKKYQLSNWRRAHHHHLVTSNRPSSIIHDGQTQVFLSVDRGLLKLPLLGIWPVQNQPSSLTRTLITWTGNFCIPWSTAARLLKLDDHDRFRIRDPLDSNSQWRLHSQRSSARSPSAYFLTMAADTHSNRPAKTCWCPKQGPAAPRPGENIPVLKLDTHD
jgi:hypothetical protein